ncbi:MAG: hypothetical protein H6779_01525 [Candidatus Nomurabacteria bacterium]|nr:MAG: hypothetical protein H6779_01525 [Candidatus Nomurabacteria bacterium]
MIKFILTCVLTLSPIASFAATDQFTIKTLVGDDTQPPTTPVLLSAVPVTASQIDLAWSVSTDNLAVGGYVLSRDSVAIATTTLTSYSDSGLNSETPYTYEVYAFDTSYNLSTTSNALSTTTLSLPPPPTTPTSTDIANNSGSQSTRAVQLKNIEVITFTNKAILEWQTYGISRYLIRWGKTYEYKDGYITNETFSTSHKTILAELEPATDYWYELTAITPSGNKVILKTGQFKTVETTEIFSPPNVLRLQARQDIDDVILSWQSPTSVSIKEIRVVRNPNSYPADIYDGKIIYSGTGAGATDKGALKDAGKQFYSVFVIDDNDNISSGAVVSVSRFFSSPVESTNDLPATGTISTDSDKVENTELTDELPSILGREDIYLLQSDLIYTFASERIPLVYQEQFVIRIPYEALPKHLKSIIVTILDPTDQRRSYSFLLRLNTEKTAYEATIAPLNVLGVSRLQVEVFDFEAKVVATKKKQIDFVVSNVQTNPEVVFPDKIVTAIKYTSPLFYLGVGTFLILFLLWLIKRRGEDN